MADKNERVYIINLRREFSKAPSYKKASKAIIAVKEFISKHMKTKEVVIGQHLNKLVWSNGKKNPPAKVEVKAVRQENKVFVELVNAPIKEPVKETKKKQTKKTEEPKKEEVKEAMKEEKKIDEKLQKEKVPKASELKAKKKF